MIIKYLSVLFIVLYINSSFAQVAVTATGGTTTATYTTLKASFDAINAGTHQGVINIAVTANTTETASAVLNASGSGSASYTSVYIKPAASATPTISGSIANGPIVKINGANNVTIDGSNNGTASRNLTISNTSTTSPLAIILGSVGTAALTGDTLKNCNVTIGANTNTAIMMCDATAAPGAAAGYFNNITIRNNSVKKAYIGMYILGVVATNNGSNLRIAENDLNATGANAIRNLGIYVQGIDGATISNNNIANFVATNAEYDRGIWVATGTTNTTVSNNNISALAYNGAAGYAPIGISISPAVSNANIMVTGNTLSNITSNSEDIAMGILSYSAASGISIEKNKISNIKNTNTDGYGSCGILLASSLSASATTVSNNFIWDVASYGFNGYDYNDNGNGIVVESGGGYNVYNNTVWLNTNQTVNNARAAAFLVTSDVTAASSINLRNNIFVNTQTTGNGNSRFALVNNGPGNVFATINYNDYYSTSTNLTSQGTNASITNTLAQLQTAIGGNANSQNVLPVFTSTTDLHLIPASNLAINNTGVPIASITTDIDGDVRNTTVPDIGADEFEYCPTVSFTTQPAPVTICEGTNPSFTVAATNGNVFQWQVNSGSGFTNITNGGIYSGATTATLNLTLPTAAMNGYIYRCLVGYSAFCTAANSNTALLTVNAKPSVIVTTSGPVSFCTGGSVTLSVPTGANLTYTWSNGSTNVSSSNSYTATVTGTYTVAVNNTVTNCNATSVPVSVSVGAGPISVIAGAATRYVCPGDTLTLIDLSASSAGTSYIWTRNGTVITGAASNSISVTDTGYYTMTVIVGPTCSTVSSPVHVLFNPLPPATVTPASPLNICQGSSDTLKAPPSTNYNYQWYNGSSTPITAATNSYYVVNTAGSYTVRVTITATGCKSTSLPVVVNIVPLPSATITPSAPTTACDTLTLTANNDVLLSYQWLLNNGIIPGANQQQFVANVTGSYSVITQNGNNCVKTSAPVNITIHPSPDALVTYNSPITFCEGGAVALTAYNPGGYTYQWSRNGLPVSGATTANFVANQTGPIAVMVTNSFGCTKFSAPVPVVVYPLPNPVISTSGMQLSTGLYNSYQWFFNNAAIPGAVNANYWATQNGGYRVSVTDGNGCVNQSATVIINNVGVQQITGLDNNVQLYPNPFKNSLSVKTDNEKTKSIELISITGAVIATKHFDTPVNEGSISINDIADGIYLVRITTDKSIYTGKVKKASE